MIASRPLNTAIRTSLIAVLLMLALLPSQALAQSDSLVLDNESFLFPKLEYMPRFLEALRAKDYEDIGKMAESQQVFLLEPGTTVEVRERADATLTVIVIDGDYSGQTGYIAIPQEHSEPLAVSVDQVVLVKEEQIFITKDEATMHEIENHVIQRNYEPLETIVEQGNAHLINRGERLEIQQISRDLIEVTVLDGEHKGKTGWVHVHSVEAP